MQIFLIFTLLVFLCSCKNESKNSDKVVENNKIESDRVYKDKEIEEALYDGYFVKNQDGYDITIFNNNLYLLKSNPSKGDKLAHFFLEIKTRTTQDPTVDILPQEFYYNDSLSENFSNVAVYKYPLPTKKEDYDILIGQFNDNGRMWSTYLERKYFKEGNQNYKNEYVNNIKTNRFLDAFESAFDEGYFIQHQENFDLLIDKSTIYYIKPKTETFDLDTQFYLHVTYENNQDKLIIDFNGNDYRLDQMLGSKYKNFVIVKKSFPLKGNILEIGTGQFNSKGRTWGVLYNLLSLYDNMAFIYNDQYRDLIE